MTRIEWNAIVARYTAALTARVNTHDPSLVPERDLAVADALLAVLEGERRLRATEGGCVDRVALRALAMGARDGSGPTVEFLSFEPAATFHDEGPDLVVRLLDEIDEAGQ